MSLHAVDYFFTKSISTIFRRRCSSMLRCCRFSMSDVYIGRTVVFTYTYECSVSEAATSILSKFSGEMKCKMKWNAVCPTLTLDKRWPAAWQPGWMAWGWHSFTCHPHVYQRMEWRYFLVNEERMKSGTGWGQCFVFHSVLWYCWLGDSKDIHPCTKPVPLFPQIPFSEQVESLN